MRRKGLWVLALLQVFLLAGVLWGQPQDIPRLSREEIAARFNRRIPREWGQKVTGVRTRMANMGSVIALTFDACGGRPGNGGGYDADLIRYLSQEGVPATLFLSGRWIAANRETVRKLAENPLFRIENHGLNHRPCSAIGKSAYGIQGTKNAMEVVDEIAENARNIEGLTGRRPEFYRPGTGYIDEVCVEIANLLGHEVVNFGVVGDGGATYSRGQVMEALLKAPASSIVVMHMNRPGSETAKGLMEAVPELRRRGIQFFELSSQGLR